MKERSAFSKWEIVPRVQYAVWNQLSEAQLFVGSFALLVLLGTCGLRWLPGIYTGEPLNWRDSLFTATSAICVTGMGVVDMATYFTPAGQLYLLLLIQVGGLGIVAFTSLIIVAFGRRLSLRQEALSTGGADADVAPHVSRQHLIRDVIRFTFAIEALGALVLYLLWAPQMGWREAAWPAVFHSISAFCNAGFSTFTDSMIPFQQSPATLLVVTALVVVGGLGFLTLEELKIRWRAGKTAQVFRVSLHTRLVLWTTVALLLGGWGLFVVFEWYGTLQALPLADKITNGLFMSAMARSGGFHAINYADAHANSLFLSIVMMGIGGAPGSTAGGMKVTTFALIGLLAWSRYRGQEVVSVASRSVPADTVDRAVGVFAAVFAMTTLFILILSTSELVGSTRLRFLDCMFDAASMFNTCGLSTGLTPTLTPAGRVTGAIMMFLGRVGPLTFAAALARRRVSSVSRLRYAYEDVVVG